MKLAFVIPFLGEKISGGADRVGAYMASELASRGHDVMIFMYSGLSLSLHLPLHPNIITIPHAPPIDFRDVAVLRKSLLDRGVEVCISFLFRQELLFWTLAVRGTQIRLCISERNDPWWIEENVLHQQERRACMTMADTIHLLQEPFMASLPTILHNRVRVIPNPLDSTRFFSVTADGAKPRGKKASTAPGSVCCVGRFFDNHKQFSLAIEAFSLLPPSCAGWTLDIYGDGRDRGIYERMIDDLHLHDRVLLHGYCENMQQAYAAADICAIPSAFEGLSGTMIEAMMNALPIVAYNDCHSIRYALTDNETALFAPARTPDAFAACLGRLMLDAPLRERLGRNAQAHAMAAYAPEKIIPQWEVMLEECARADRNDAYKRQADAAANVLHEAVRAFRENVFSILRNNVHSGK